MEQWTQIPLEADVEVAITKGDLDNLYFAINHLNMSQASMQEALIKYSNGELDDANQFMDASRRSNIESLNALRGLFTALMSSAVQRRGNAK